MRNGRAFRRRPTTQSPTRGNPLFVVRRWNKRAIPAASIRSFAPTCLTFLFTLNWWMASGNPAVLLGNSESVAHLSTLLFRGRTVALAHRLGCKVGQATLLGRFFVSFPAVLGS